MNHRCALMFLLFATSCSSNTVNARSEPANALASGDNSQAHATTGNVTVTADSRPTTEVSPTVTNTLGMPNSQVSSGDVNSGQSPSQNATTSRSRARTRARSDAGTTPRTTPPQEPTPTGSSEPSEEAPLETAADGGAVANDS